MKEIPILFSTPMVQAILEGRKTQTRRVIKPQPVQKIMGGGAFDAMKALGVSDNPIGWTWKGTRYMPWPEFLQDHLCPYGKSGDVLWVRETFYESMNHGFMYKADGHHGKTKFPLQYSPEFVKWKPSLFMPKAACRIFLQVESVKVERLHDISEEDAIAEGIQEIGTPEHPYKLYAGKNGEYSGWAKAVRSFQSLWESINGEESWIANPWVWVIKFKRIER